jgi:ankyrin repeat protein
MRCSTGLMILACLAANGCGHAGIDAATRGDLKAVQAWLAEGGQVNSRGPGDRTALHAAAACGHTEVVQYLLTNKADPNPADEQGNTPLCLIMLPEKSPNEAPVARALTAGGANVDKTCGGESPLHFASIHYKWDALIPLLEKGARTRREYSKAEEPLCKAALSARADVVALMLKNGEDPNKHDAAAIFDALNTPQEDSWEVVKLLVEHGTNLKVQQKGDGTGDTALHRVVLLRNFGSARIVDIMVSHGADPYAVNRNQELPLDTAMAKSQEIAERMVKHMALELPTSDTLKKAYDKMVMAGLPGPVLATIERMMALGGYLRVQARLVAEGGYDKSIKDSSQRSAIRPANQEEAEVYTGLVTYAGALLGTLANAAAEGKLSQGKARDNFKNLISTVASDTATENEKRLRAGAGSSPAAAKIAGMIELIKTLEGKAGR